MTAHNQAATIEALPYALRNLRHLYEQLLVGRIGVQAAAATGLLGPAIEKVERVEAAIVALRAQLAAMTKERDELTVELGHATAHEGDWLSKTSRAMCDSVLGEREALRWKLRDMTTERDTARAERDALAEDLRESARYHTDVCGKVEAERDAMRKGLEAMRASCGGGTDPSVIVFAFELDALIGKAGE